MSEKSWESSVEKIHNSLKNCKEIGPRLRAVAELLLGRPYVSNGLIGSAKIKEKMVLDLNEFDCVTFVENTFALARSHSAQGFRKELIWLRYRNGEIAWNSRLHYFSDWFHQARKRGSLAVKTRGPEIKQIRKTLNLISDLPPCKTMISVVPKKALPKVQLVDGSIVAFASVRKGLDFFHVGLLFKRATKGKEQSIWYLYHASKSAGKVVAEPLKDFLTRNRTRGIAIAVPLSKRGK